MLLPFRRFSLAAAAVCILSSTALLAQCGVERWSVKTGTDPDAGKVNLSSSTNTTIPAMRAFTAPSPIPSNSRITGPETTQWVINATLVEFKSESDSDYHLVIRDASGVTMITEIPSPSCVGSTSPFLTAIRSARAKFNAKFTPTSSFQTVNIPVQIVGVGMFDFLHGQTGVAPNGIELHPVLDIIFNPGTPTPDFSVSASPASISIAQGSSGDTTISSSVSGGFNSPVSLSVTGLPAGVTASFSPGSIAAPGSGSATLTFSATSGATTGTANVTVSASGGGVSHNATVAVTITSTGGGGGGGGSQLLGNPGFEGGSLNPSPWTVATTAATARVINSSATEPPHSGSWDAWFDGHGSTTTDSILQQVTIPSNATSAALSFWLHVDTAETSTTRAFDTLTAQVRNSSGTVLSTLATLSNLNAASGYQQETFDLTSFKGQTIQIFLQGKEDSTLQTSFVVDDFALNVAAPGSTDTTPPTTSITAPTNGSTVSGNVTILGTASDNVGVTQMKMFVDGSLVASNSNATSLSFVWVTSGVADGSHTITLQSSDAAGNVGAASPVTVTVSNSGGGTTTELMGNGGFENGSSSPTPWTVTSSSSSTPQVINSSSSEPAHAGSWDAWLDGTGSSETDAVTQQVSIPSTATAATLSFWLHIDTAETSTTKAFDKLSVQVLDAAGNVLSSLATFSNLNAGSGYQQHSFNVSSFAGQTIQIRFSGSEDFELQTSFVIDDVSLQVTQ